MYVYLMESTTCKKCGVSGLSWRKSAKGYWYLASPSIVTTNTYGNFLTIPFAHKCQDAAKQEASMIDFQKSQLAALEAKAIISDLNEYEIQELEYYRSLFA